MTSSDFKSVENDGKLICDNLIAVNKGDYLTKKVVKEVENVIKEAKKLDKAVSTVGTKIEEKRAEIRRREEAARKKKEEENKSDEDNDDNDSDS